MIARMYRRKKHTLWPSSRYRSRPFLDHSCLHLKDPEPPNLTFHHQRINLLVPLLVYSLHHLNHLNHVDDLDVKQKRIDLMIQVLRCLLGGLPLVSSVTSAIEKLHPPEQVFHLEFEVPCMLEVLLWLLLASLLGLLQILPGNPSIKLQLVQHSIVTQQDSARPGK